MKETMNNNAAMRIINEERLIQFIQGFADCWFSDERPLIDELKYISKKVSHGDIYALVADRGVAEVVDLYHSQRLAFTLMEFSEEELRFQAEHAYTAAAKKILWMNTMCKVETGRPFIIARIDIHTQQAELIDAYTNVVRSYVMAHRQ